MSVLYETVFADFCSAKFHKHEILISMVPLNSLKQDFAFIITIWLIYSIFFNSTISKERGVERVEGVL